MTDGAAGPGAGAAGGPGDDDPGAASPGLPPSIGDRAPAVHGAYSHADHGAGAPADHGAYAHATAEQLLSQTRNVRRQARRVRHAYWFPLVLFGLLTCASVPFYLQRLPPGYADFVVRHQRPTLLQSAYLGGLRVAPGTGNAYYWLAAILAGIAVTAAWYRLRGDRVGLRTPARGFVVTGLALLVLALVIPILASRAGIGPLQVLMPGDLLIRGTFPFVLIGVGLCVLAWAERSIALTVIAAGFLGLVPGREPVRHRERLL